MNPVTRLARLQHRLGDEGCDALVFSSPANVIYMTGFERVFDDEPSSVGVVTRESARVYVDSRYAEAAREAADGSAISVIGPERDVWERVLSDLGADGPARIAIEASTPHARYTKVSGAVRAEVVAADGWIERVRAVKEAEEIERIARAAALADAAFDHVLGAIREGMTEADLALDIEFFMRRHGSEGVAFPPIVASGPHSSRPHAKVTDRQLERGDLLTLDFGACVDGYCSDLTRTVAIGAIGDEERAMYEAVLAANAAGIAAIRAGRTGSEIDAAARRIITDAGYGDYFGHNLGHGVGVEVHEGPTLGPRGSEPVPSGAVVTVEPGVYVPGLGGVRIEDLVAVGEDAPVVLSRSPKDLIVV